jgi:hypothetical protein
MQKLRQALRPAKRRLAAPLYDIKPPLVLNLRINYMNITINELEDFIVNNNDLEVLEAYLNEFNIFEVLKSSEQELKHSNTLAFLLNPKEKHGLRDYFLKKLLIATIVNNDNIKISPIEIDNLDLSDSIIKREYKNIDILIESKENKFICVIENKINSQESDDQLLRYRNIIDSEYKDYKKMFVFLSPMGLEPSDNENWLICSYDIVASIIEVILEYKKSIISNEQITFITHYNAIIRRYLLENSKEVELARKIYSSHKNALDFIIKYITDNRQEIYNHLKSLLEKDKSYITSYSTLSRIRFTTNELNKLLPNIGDGRWNKVEQVFLFEINNSSDYLSIIMVMGPTNDVYRKKAFDKLKKDFIPKYIKYKVSLSEMYNTIYTKFIINKEEYQSMDVESMKIKINSLFENEIKSDIKEITEYFKTNIEYFQHVAA